MSSSALAHSPSKDGSRIDTVADHLKAVSERAAEYAAAFGAADEARLAGLLHDLGKYGELFQKRLRGEAEHVDHWSAGAWQACALSMFTPPGLASALAIQGHHVGLQQLESLRCLNPAKWDPKMHGQWRLSETKMETFMQCLRNDGLLPAAPASSLYDHASRKVAAMLDVRMLFSALVDADFIETEAHFNAIGAEKTYRKPSPELEPARALGIVLTRIEEVARESQAAATVNTLRADLLTACLEKAASSQGQYTLTAPTGSGKTLAMLVFALKHAATHSLRRIVMVIPYLNIIDQTAKVYRSILTPKFGEDYVLEHHSLAGTRGKDNTEGFDENRQGGLAENWDAPVVVTTSVQMLESLFANRPSACWKLHRLAQSVILFDEVQTLPTDLAIPTLAALSRLVERYQATAVFATATQPAFSHLDEHVRKWCVCGWQPTEIVPTGLRLFDRARRTKVEWPDLDSHTTWDELAGRLAADECRQVLCVVNLKRHALLLFQKLRALSVPEEGLFHLSTNMCPAHRKEVLDEVLHRLVDRERPPCRLISTQCVEAGVDVDFPIAYRAWGPLDSIAQVAGRCNRNGRLQQPGLVHVFVPEDEAYPPKGYGQAASTARVLFKCQAAGLDLDDPTLFQEYYRRLYSIARPEDRNEALRDAIARQDFAMVAELFRVIPDASINVLVPYDAKAYLKLADGVRRDGISRDWIRAVRPYTIGVYRPKPDTPIARWLEPVKVSATRRAEDWFIYLRAEHYDRKTGLTTPESLEFLNG